MLVDRGSAIESRELDDELPTWRQGPHRSLEVRGNAGQGHVAEDQYIDDLRLEDAVPHARQDLRQVDEPLDRDRRANALERHAIGQMGGHRREDVATVEARADNRE